MPYHRFFPPWRRDSGRENVNDNIDSNQREEDCEKKRPMTENTAEKGGVLVIVFRQTGCSPESNNSRRKPNIHCRIIFDPRIFWIIQDVKQALPWQGYIQKRLGKKRRNTLSDNSSTGMSHTGYVRPDAGTIIRLNTIQNPNNTGDGREEVRNQ